MAVSRSAAARGPGPCARSGTSRTRQGCGGGRGRLPRVARRPRRRGPPRGPGRRLRARAAGPRRRRTPDPGGQPTEALRPPTNPPSVGALIVVRTARALRRNRGSGDASGGQPCPRAPAACPPGRCVRRTASRSTSSSTLALGVLRRQPSRPGQGRQPVQGRPEHLGEQPRVDAVPGDLAEGLQQGGEGVLQRLRGVLLRVRQAAVELEQGVVDRRVACGEVEVGAGEGGDPGARAVRGGGRGPHRRGQFGGALQGDGADDLALAAEVAVEDGPGVGHEGCGPTSGRTVPRLRRRLQWSSKLVDQVRRAAWASMATFTRAAKAAGSVTARSARTLRSTSTSASFSPLMNRL